MTIVVSTFTTPCIVVSNSLLLVALPSCSISKNQMNRNTFDHVSWSESSQGLVKIHDHKIMIYIKVYSIQDIIDMHGIL